MAWLLAHKLEMTRIVKNNTFVPVTLLEIPELRVIAIKTKEADWYNALVIWILKKDWKAEVKDWNKALSFNQFSKIKEVSLSDWDVEKFKVGDTLNFETLEWVEKVDVTSFSKWKWFTWAMKKHNFHGWPKTHGSKFHRALGSIGNRKPKRTHKGKKMHGHHWDVRVSLKWVPLELLNKDLKVFGLRGPIPGARKSLVIVNF